MSAKALISNDDVAKRLLAVRLALGFNQQKDFAESFGSNGGVYSKWETGKARFSLDAAVALRETYGISLDFIYFGNFDTLSIKMAKDVLSKLRDSASIRSSDKSE